MLCLHPINTNPPVACVQCSQRPVALRRSWTSWTPIVSALRSCRFFLFPMAKRTIFLGYHIISRDVNVVDVVYEIFTCFYNDSPNSKILAMLGQLPQSQPSFPIELRPQVIMIHPDSWETLKSTGTNFGTLENTII